MSAAPELPITPELSLSRPAVFLPSFGGYIPQAGELQGVTFWPRVGARLIDTFVHYFAGYGSGWLFGRMVVMAANGHVPRAVILKFRHPGPSAFLFAVLGFLVYQVICTSVCGSSLGKRLLSMVVVQEDGSSCKFTSAVVRELGYFVDAPFFGMIGYAAMQDTDEQQRHGDDWAHTVVCKRNLIRPDVLHGEDRFILAFLLALMANVAVRLLGFLVLMAG